MVRVQKIRTFDGVLHDGVTAAQRHLDRLYSDAITRVSVALNKATGGSYRGTAEFIDANLTAFVELQTIKADMSIPADDFRDGQCG